MRALVDLGNEPRVLGDRVSWVVRAGWVAAAAGSVVAVALGAFSTAGWRGFFFAYLQAWLYFASIALGALFFVMLQHLTNTGWSVVVRRLAEAMAATLPLLALLFLPIVAGVGELYHWSHAAAVAADPLLQWKSGYLNTPFFLVRCAIYLGVWAWLARFFVGRSVAQDASGDVAHTVAMRRRAAPGMFLFAFTVTFAAFDLLMSLDPHWYSTMLGVYFFAGSAVGFFAALIVFTYLVQRAGFLRRAITREHYHDLGKLLFAFTVFWAYISFSQFMLMWYANIPEETLFYLHRQEHGWEWVGLALVFGHFLLPFLVLLSRAPKRRKGALAAAAGWLLLMHWVDLYWFIMPVGSEHAAVNWASLALTVGLGGVLVARLLWGARSVSLVPEKDPRLLESLTFENA